MPTIQKPSNFHHFTPRSHLRRFSVGTEGRQVVVFDKKTGRSWTAGLWEAGAGQGYNTLVQPDGSKLNFESDFDQIDAAYAEIGDALAEGRNVANLTQEFRVKLADVVAVQALRTPIMRSTLMSIPRQLAALVREMGLEAPAEADLPNDNATRQTTRKMIKDRARIRDALLAKDVVLFAPSGSARFWTSDHPVVRRSNSPSGDTGFESLGVEVYLPIAPDLMLGLFCPSLLMSLTRQPFEQLDMAFDQRTRLIAKRDAFIQGSPCMVTDADVDWFNSCQVADSRRFVYASTDDFDLARRMLADHPDLSAVESLMTLGEMGRAPPRSRNLPPGEWLYLEGQDRWELIPIANWQSDNTSQMTTDDPDRLRAALARAPFVVAQVYAKTGGRMMRDAGLEVLDWGPPVRFRLIFADPGMNALDALLRSRSV